MLAMDPALEPRPLAARTRDALRRIADPVPDFAVGDFSRPEVAEALRDTDVLFTG
ncbi:hypothetical protein [Streptomyces sp. NPDC001970]